MRESPHPRALIVAGALVFGFACTLTSDPFHPAEAHAPSTDIDGESNAALPSPAPTPPARDPVDAGCLNALEGEACGLPLVSKGSPCAEGRDCPGDLCSLDACVDGSVEDAAPSTEAGAPDTSALDAGDAGGLATEPGSCTDGARNQDESDVDCGGRCGACEPGRECSDDADCESGICEDERCCGGSLGDCTRCALRLAINRSCESNGPAAAGDCSSFLQCLSDNAEICIRRLSPGCTEDPDGVCNHESFGGNASPGVRLADAILGSARCIF